MGFQISSLINSAKPRPAPFAFGAANRFSHGKRTDNAEGPRIHQLLAAIRAGDPIRPRRIKEGIRNAVPNLRVVVLEGDEVFWHPVA